MVAAGQVGGVGNGGKCEALERGWGAQQRGRAAARAIDVARCCFVIRQVARTLGMPNWVCRSDQRRARLDDRVNLNDLLHCSQLDEQRRGN